LHQIFQEANFDVQRMFDLMHHEIRSHIKPKKFLAQKGDVLIWHPGILHGGSYASNQSKTRNSLVFHISPFGVNLRDDNFFLKNFLNFPTYGLIKKNGNYFARSRLPIALI
jgi:ectoine hydroxylase-related dioxygenase (phytanoyl-CoA dioxygenase family)